MGSPGGRVAMSGSAGGVAVIGYGVTRIDLLQALVVDVFEEELAIPIIWGRSDLPREKRPFARFDLLSGPTRIQVKHEWDIVTTESDRIVDIPVPTEGIDYLMRVNGVPLRHVAVSGETQATMRDAFIVLVNGDREPATATIESATQLRVTELLPGSLPYFDIDGQLSQAVADDSVQQCVKVHFARSEVTFTMQLVGEDNAVGTDRSAGDLIGMVSLILDLDRTLLKLNDERITMNDIAGPTDISDLEGGGAKSESRHTMDFAATITSMYSEVVPTIETVEGSVVVGSNTVPLDVTTSP